MIYFFCITLAIIMYIYQLNNKSYIRNYYKAIISVKRIIPNNIYNKYFTKIYVVYKGKSIKSISNIHHYAYVSFVTTNRYFNLINSTIYSVHYYSKYPIILYISGKVRDINMKIFSQYDRLVVFSISPEMKNIYFMKLRVALIAPVIVGQIVESDTIVLPGADCLFKRIEKEISAQYSYPMMTRHTDIRSPIKGNGTINILNYPMINRSMRYMHAHMSWTYNSLKYIAKIYAKSMLYNYGNDELALNYNLWEDKAYKQWCTYDPSYKSVDLFSNNNIFKGINEFEKIVIFNFIHGCKSNATQNIILSKLKLFSINKYKLIYLINKKIFLTKSCKIDKRLKSIIKLENCII